MFGVDLRQVDGWLQRQLVEGVAGQGPTALFFGHADSTATSGALRGVAEPAQHGMLLTFWANEDNALCSINRRKMKECVPTCHWTDGPSADECWFKINESHAGPHFPSLHLPLTNDRPTH